MKVNLMQGDCQNQRRAGMSKFNANGGWYYASQDNWNRSGGFMIARVGPYVISDKAVSQAEWNHLANALLIAAAPELLASLEKLHAILSKGGVWTIEDQKAAHEAIAKAKGEQE